MPACHAPPCAGRGQGVEVTSEMLKKTGFWWSRIQGVEREKNQN
jgi:hypothetical protein